MDNKKVVVMGSFVVDLMMKAKRLPVEGETIKGTVFESGAGGKGANQCVAAARAGAETVIITKIGNDSFGKIAIDSFNKNNIDTKFVFTDNKRATGAALIMVDENTGQNKIIVTTGACDNIAVQEIEKARCEIESAKIFLTQLETNKSATLKSINIAHDAGIKIMLNPAPAENIPPEYYSKIDYFTPNETEAEFLSNIKIKTKDEAKRAALFFLDKGVKNCIITLGKAGALLCNQNTTKIFPPYKVKAIDSTGAGDAFNGGLSAALAEDKSIEESIMFANATAALSVTKTGTAKAMPTRAEIDNFIKKRENIIPRKV